MRKITRLGGRLRRRCSLSAVSPSAPPAGDSPGDHYVYSGDVFDRKGGKNFGRVGGDCETLSTIAAHPERPCTVTFVLAGGEIVGAGTFNTADLFGGGQTLAFP